MGFAHFSSLIFKMPKTRRSAGGKGGGLWPLLSIEQPAELKPTFGFLPNENTINWVQYENQLGFHTDECKSLENFGKTNCSSSYPSPVLRQCGLAQCIPGCTPDVGAFYGPKSSPGTLWSAPASAMFLTFRHLLSCLIVWALWARHRISVSLKTSMYRPGPVKSGLTE